MREWASGVKSSGKLTVISEASGIWVNIIPVAIESFNKLNKQFGFGVKLKSHKDKDTADVVVVSTDGTGTHAFNGGGSATARLNGTAIHGQTSHAADDTGLTKCVVFLPNSPSFSGGFINGKEVRESASKDVLRVIAVHEFVHACGLNSNNDHDTTGLFVQSLQPTGKKLHEAMTKNPGMPPMRLGPSTISKLKSLW